MIDKYSGIEMGAVVDGVFYMSHKGWLTVMVFLLVLVLMYFKESK